MTKIPLAFHMTEHSFALIPFPDSELPDIQINGNLSRDSHILSVHYEVHGDIGTIVLPKVSLHPSRRNELWQQTCFEFFAAVPNEAGYWEFNLSPGGDWNIYRMDAYRRIGFREETSLGPLPISVKTENGLISMDATVGIGPIVDSQTPIDVGITSILQTAGGHETYWALAHPGSQADFHLRESFILRL